MHSTFPLRGQKPVGICHDVTEKLDWCGNPTAKKFEDMFGRFDRIPACDGQTDGHFVAAYSPRCA